MDLNAIKARLDSLNESTQQREKVDYDAIFWKPPVGKSVIRIVPSAYDPTFPFSELKFHYGVGKYPMIALSNFGKQDPIEEFVKELRKTDDRDNWSLAGKLTPKTRTFAPVVVRGEEDKGVRLWGFSKTVYKALLSLAEDEDIGDYTDVVNGFDLVVELTEGNPYPTTTVRIKPKMTPLHDDNNLVETWLKEQPEPKTSFSQYDYNFIKKQLQNYVDGTSDDDEAPAPTQTTTSSNSNDDSFKQTGQFDWEKKESSDFTLENKSAEKSDPVSKFDELFND